MVRMIGRAALLVGLLFLWGSAALAASVDVAETEMAFVDAWGDTGYYVDMKSLDFQNDHEVTARVQIVCADKDRLYLYRIHFDRKKRTYQILDSVMAVYTTKEPVGGNAVPTAVTPYANGSPMAAVVEYIFSPQP